MEHLDLVEDAVQDAFLKAFQYWKISGPPENKTGWLYLTAKNKVIDALRRSQKLPEVLEKTKIYEHDSNLQKATFSHHEIEDSQLQMMFSICIPELKSEDRIALILKIISGFSMKEIANALLISEDTVKQRISRAKKKIRQNEVKLSIPSGGILVERLNNVLTALYLVFNEGYYSSKQIEPIRKDLCLEAMRLTKILAEHPAGSSQASFALLALMCYHASRFDSRLSPDNQWISIAEQDRSKWDRQLINVGNLYMHRAAQHEGGYHVYQIEAAIAAIHCHAESLEDTSWENLLSLYEILYRRKPSPIIKLNTAILLIQLKRFEKAKIVLNELRETLGNHHLYAMVWGEFYEKQGFIGEAIDRWLQAISLTQKGTEIEWIKKKISKLDQA